jgi:Tfp pilus assembly protein PilF
MRAWVTFLVVAWSGAAGVVTGAETWIEVESPNFTVVSNAGERTAGKTAAEFEQVRAAYAKVWPWAHLAQGKPMIVLALRNERTLRRWAPSYYEVKGGIDVSSGWASGVDRVYLLLRTDYRPSNVEVTPAFNLYRAYVQLLLANSFERRLPPWLSNGLGEVLGNTFVSDKEISVGRPVPWEFEQFNRGGRLPLQTVLDARSDSPLLNQESERQLFDAQSYMLVHYLMFGDQRAHARELGRFERLWLAGRSHDEAFAESFGDLKTLEGQLVSYATRRLVTYARLPAEAKINEERPVVHALPPAEVAGLQAAVHVAMGRPVDAQAAIREARTADPRSPASYDAEGLVADRDQDKTRATQAYAHAVELGSTNAYSHYRTAQLAWKPQADASTLAQIRQQLERAIELNASFANAYSYLAEVLVQQGDDQRALAQAQGAVALEPGASYHRVALARVLHDLGRDDEARKSAELGLQLADDDADRSNAERFLLFLKEDVRYARERAKQEELQKQTDACEGGDAAACAQILPDLERSCGEKQARNCMYLSWLYSGTGLARDAAKAAGYLEQACAAGDKRACVEHAWKLVNGDGVTKDVPAGVAALQSLCDEAYYAACTRLAVVEAGKTGAKAHARAKALLARACQGGEQDACSMATQLK